MVCPESVEEAMGVFFFFFLKLSDHFSLQADRKNNVRVVRVTEAQ